MRPAPLDGPAFAAFTAPARCRPALWRVVLGLLLAALLWLAAIALLVRLIEPRGEGAGLIAYLVSFAGLAGGVVLAAWLLGGRGPRSLIGPGGIRPRAFATGALMVAALAAAGVLLGGALGDPPRLHADPGAWARRLPLALTAVLIQTSAEEIVFRGYLTQGLAARFRPAPVWLGLPALLFGMLHWDPAIHGPANATLVVTNAALIGLILGDVTARQGNLSLAMGLHFANNVAALLLVAAPGPLSGLALFVSTIGPEAPAAFQRMLLAALAANLAGYGLWLGWNLRHPAR